MTILQAEKKTLESSLESLTHQIKQLNNQVIQKDDYLRNRIQQLDLHFLSKFHPRKLTGRQGKML
jgi:conjugal transfer/entry exclusion protein